MKGLVALVIAVLVLIILIPQVLFIVSEMEQVIITRFGKPIGDAIDEPGLKVKVPFIDKVNTFDKRWLEWDGDPNEVPTSDKKYIIIDTYARWRIADPLKFFQVVKNESGAQSRLDDIIDGETRNVVASYDLIELVRSSNRDFEVSEQLKKLIKTDVPDIAVGRSKLEEEILNAAAEVMPNFGIELVDVRFKRINYRDEVRQKVFDRMISERRQIAERYRSEGQGNAAEIRGQMERELKRIQSGAYRTSEEIRGRADAGATKIYADAYAADPQFYAFIKTLESWEKSLSKDTRMILTTDSEYFKYMKQTR
jgi:modulator of FtsH protease HflC